MHSEAPRERSASSFRSRARSLTHCAYSWAREKEEIFSGNETRNVNKAGYTATLVALGWGGAVMEVTVAFGQER